MRFNGKQDETVPVICLHNYLMASLTKSILKFMAGSKPHRNKLTTSSSTYYQNFFFAFIFVNILCFISSTFLTSVSAITSPESEESNSVDCSPNDPNFPLCRHCPCNRAGVLDPENCDEPCECKPSVIGQFCDQCKPGYVNLNSDNPEGCTKCFCFNVTTSCRITYWPSQIITNPADWKITTLSGAEIVDPQQEDDHLVIADDDAPSAPYYYWSAPREYLGDMYPAYGRKAKISLSATVLRGDSAGSPVYGPDIVLEGEDSQGSRLLIGHSWKPIPFVRAERTKINRKIVLSERNWFRLHDDGSNSSRVTRDEFVMVLSNLKRFLIRAYFHTDQIEGSFYNVDVLVASPNGDTDPATGRITQECDCPEGYERPSCGPGCSPGYRRVNNTLIGGICEKCDCNNHSLTCDAYTGECTQCLHNTQGPRCNMCSFGFYGFPLIGQPDDCKPCACPRLEPSNNFSPTCIAISRGDYVCDACQWPYTGPKCNQCVEGFTGNPTALGGSCVPIEITTTSTTSTTSTTTTSIPSTARTRTTTTTMSSWIPTEMTTYYWPTYTETWRPYETTFWYEPSTTLPPPPCRSYETTTLPPPPPPPPTKPFIVTYESCQQSCAGLHFSDIWGMETTLSKINIDDIFHFPYALASLIRKESNLRESLKHRHFILTNGLTLIGGLTGELEFNLTMDPFVGRINTSEIIAINMINSLSELLGLSTTEMNNVRSLQSSIHQTIAYINSISSDISANEPNFWDEMIRRANSWITEMSNIDLTSKLADSIVEREQSVVFLDQVSSFLSTYREQNSLLERINRLKYILRQIDNIINEQVNSPVYLADQQMMSIRNTIDALVLNATYNQERIVKYSESIREGFNHLEGSQVYFSIINKVTGDLETMSNDLNRSILAVERVRSIYSRLNPFYEDVYVNRCRDRVDKELSRINGAIEEYNITINLLKPYIDIPQSNNQTVVLIERAEIDAEEAINTIVSQVIDSVVKPGTTSRATELRGTSNQIFREVIQQSITISERSSQLIEIIRFNEESRLVTDCFKDHETILAELNNFTVSIEASSRDTIEFSYILDMGLKSIESRVAEINQSLGIIEGPVAARIEEKWIAEMNEASNLVNQSSNLVKSILDNTERLSDVVSKVRYQRRGMDTNLADLRKRVLLAKQKAAEIRIALASEPDMYCIRSYVIETQPSSANSISMNYAIDQENVRDALIFSIVNPDDGDFLAIDMVNRSIRFLWSLGPNGLTIIEHPMQLETSPENMEEDAHWYHIEAERIGTIGTLNVQRVVDANVLSDNPVKSVSSANYSILDVTSAHRLWIGGHLELDGFFVPSGAVVKGFQGCLADLMYDEKHIGLWDFSYSSPTGCKPCSKSALESGDYGVFQFNGKSSYSVLDQIPRYDNRNYQVVMLMKTFDESAIIFFCSDVETGNYIAIHIVNGRVSFSFRDGPETWLKLVTTDKYNNGEWFRVTAARSETRAILSVDKENIEGEVEAYNSDLGDCKIHFGGVPPNFTTHHWPNLDFKPFLGCMKDVQIDTTPLNLMNGETFGLSTGCKNDLPRSAKFNGQGFLEMKGLPLLDNDVISLTFKTNQSEAILLMATFKNPKKPKKELQYYSLAITVGSLEARFNPGSSEALLISRVSVNDGHFHTVAITKRNRRVWMTVDDYEVVTAKLGPGRNIGASASESKLFIGGVPQSTEWFKILGTNQSLNGVIKDFITDGKVIYFNNFVTFDSVEIGRGV